MFSKNRLVTRKTKRKKRNKKQKTNKNNNKQTKRVNYDHLQYAISYIYFVHYFDRHETNNLHVQCLLLQLREKIIYLYCPMVN